MLNKDMLENLSRPFPSSVLSVKPGAVSGDGRKALALIYIQSRAVMDRLDDAVGPENWSFDWEPLPAIENWIAVKGNLRVFGILKSDVGQATMDDTEPYKAAVSDALKRCAVHFGIGRYLYEAPNVWWEGSKMGRVWVFNDEERLLRKFYEWSERHAAKAATRYTTESSPEATPTPGEGRPNLQTGSKVGPRRAEDVRRIMDGFENPEEASHWMERIIGRVVDPNDLYLREATEIIKAADAEHRRAA